MRVVSASCVLITCLWSSACQSSPPCTEVPVLERFEIRYSGRVDGTAFQTAPAAAASIPTEGDRVLVHARILKLPLEVAMHLLPAGAPSRGGARFGLGVDCARVPAAHLRQALDRLVAARVASEVGTPPVPCALGGTAQVAQFAECAYVSAFEMKAIPQAMVGDPVVAVALEGYDLRLRPEMDGVGLALDVSLRTTGLVRPMATTSSPLVYGTMPVHIHVPAFFHQELDARPTLRSGDAVCVMCPQPPDLEAVVLLVLECEHQREELPALAQGR
jgi:hypothetical protein